MCPQSGDGRCGLGPDRLILRIVGLAEERHPDHLARSRLATGRHHGADPVAVLYRGAGQQRRADSLAGQFY
jgi:hypothetical protein